MKYQTELKDDVLFVRLEGDLIVGKDTHQMIEEVDGLQDGKVFLCAVDLSNVRFMDSSGMGVLVSLLTKFRNRGGELVLIKPSEHIRKLLIVTKLNAIFTIAENDDYAAQFLKESIY
ncbi:STAS domain-containing protein [Pontibacter sp. BT310]|jgi:anti-sigma B factor antagonist|uniref:Anti-sigma factor antagonist n=1 Tax=Pontibacter populi TaxID=890055 RepID=A0ABS6XGC1_9BACT|nr:MULTISPECIES: STAS domain-containing protein [Pontibacter]MBJ6119302.1 STAS domain-containing protein [Pontibacter sp. BT310]MBR0571730.1 STAS domain-containing protein [Microvirga sp. STS03]MBW3366156.1 STAS domain-containing protein [Pontibacter populi]